MMDLKLENEYLQTKLKALKAKHQSSPSSLYSTSSALFSRQQADNSSPFYLGSDQVKNSPTKSTFDSSALSGTNPVDDEADEGKKKKKVRALLLLDTHLFTHAHDM